MTVNRELSWLISKDGGFTKIDLLDKANPVIKFSLDDTKTRRNIPRTKFLQEY